MIEGVGLEHSHRSSERIGREDHVGIGEEQHLAGGLRRANRQGMALPHPALRQVLHTHHAQMRMRQPDGVDDGRGAIGRPIVHQQDLEGRIVEGQHRAQGVADVPLLVTGRNDHRHGGPCPGRRRLPHRIEPAQSAHAQTDVDDGDEKDDEGDEREDGHVL